MLSDIYRLSKYPKHNSKTVTRQIFISFFVMFLIFLLSGFVKNDFYKSLNNLPDNLIANSVENYDKENLDLTLTQVETKRKYLQKEFNTQVKSSIGFSSQFYYEKDTILSNVYTYFSENPDYYIKGYFSEDYRVTPTPSSSKKFFLLPQSLYKEICVEGLVCSVRLFDYKTKQVINSVEVTGYYNIFFAKTFLFRSEANDDTFHHRILADINLSESIKNSDNEHNCFSVVEFYETDRSITDKDKIVINSLFADPVYKLLEINTTLAVLNPILTIVKLISIFSVAVVIISLICLTVIRSRDISPVLMIDYIYYKKKIKVILQAISSNMIYFLKGMLYAFLISLIIILIFGFALDYYYKPGLFDLLMIIGVFLVLLVFFFYHYSP